MRHAPAHILASKRNGALDTGMTRKIEARALNLQGLDHGLRRDRRS